MSNYPIRLRKVACGVPRKREQFWKSRTARGNGCQESSVDPGFALKFAVAAMRIVPQMSENHALAFAISRKAT
jgi:hypothetical protein